MIVPRSRMYRQIDFDCDHCRSRQRWVWVPVTLTPIGIRVETGFEAGPYLCSCCEWQYRLTIWFGASANLNN